MLSSKDHLLQRHLFTGEYKAFAHITMVLEITENSHGKIRDVVAIL